MKMFTDCSGECRDCATFYRGGCLAGHGDDDFVSITEGIFNRLLDERIERRERLIERFPIYYRNRKWEGVGGG